MINVENTKERDCAVMNAMLVDHVVFMQQVSVARYAYKSAFHISDA